MGKRLLITVGTTEFDELLCFIDNDEFLKILQSLGFDHVVLQYGRGLFNPKVLTLNNVQLHWKIRLEVMAFTSAIIDEMKSADLIIGHAGAGTVLDVITLRKPLVCVINTTLQGNHQQELADALYESDMCVVTTVENIFEALRVRVPERYHSHAPAPTFPINHPEKFAAVIDSLFVLSEAI
jgi:beta-1,4-N-acetylglucosaminyltransferase